MLYELALVRVRAGEAGRQSALVYFPPGMGKSFPTVEPSSNVQGVFRKY